MLVTRIAWLNLAPSMTGKIELKWGALIGLANLAWLYASYYLGMRDSGLGLIQLTVLIGFLLSVVGYIFGLRAVFRAAPEISFVEGMRSGAVMCGLVTVIAVLAQLGYLKWVHPEFPAYIANEFVVLYKDAGASEAELEQVRQGNEKTYGLGNFLLQAGLLAFLTGVISSFIIVAVRLRLRR